MIGDDLLAALTSEAADLFTHDAARAGVEALQDVLATRPGERVEDVLLDLGLVDDTRLALALALRSGRPYEGLRDFVPDPRLFLYLPLPVAQAERLLPLMLVGDTLVVATPFADADISYLHDRFPNLAVELVIAPRTAILEALRRIDR